MFDNEKIDAILDWLKESDNTDTLMTVGVLLLVVYPVLIGLSVALGRTVSRRFSAQSGMLVRKAMFYTSTIVIVLTILGEFESIRLGPLLGAAGIAGIALGFASQTSVSNIISGLFLLSENTFVVGDVIRIGDTMGTVMSIDLLSVKVRAFDNRFIRIPNENLIKTEFVNITHFPIRRVDLTVQVGYREDLKRVHEVLREVARANPYCLDEPEPLILAQEFGESGIAYLFGVWCVNIDFINVKNTMMQDIKERFDRDNIEIPLPHRALLMAKDAGPFPMRVSSADNAASSTDTTEENAD